MTRKAHNIQSVSLIALAVLLSVASSAQGIGVQARIGDVTKIKGQRTNTLIGMGLVTGLNGTGDGDQYLPSMRPLAAALKNFANPVSSIDELGGSKNVAIVMLEVTLPEFGVREGSTVDVQVTTFGSAKSLAGGRLLVTPMLYHDRSVRDVFAFASGPIEIFDEDDATTGVVRRGATIEQDVLLHFLARGRELPFTSSWIEPDKGYITLVVDDAHASWAMVHEIATAINTELATTANVEQVALAVDPKNVVVLVPAGQMREVASWIHEVERTPLLVPEAEARVIVDRRSGTVVVSGDARISPVIISQRGLTITIAPPAVENLAPLVGPNNFVAIDPSRAADTHVGDLLEALKPLNVSVEDRIEILTKIHRLGKLHAELIFED